MYIVADIGATKTRIAGSDDLVSFTEPVIHTTPERYVDGLALFVETAKTIADGRIEHAVAGIPSVLSPDKRVPLNTIHPDWRGKPFADDAERALDTRLSLENDTALVGLGEAVAGAGKDASIVAYVTVSTGVNGVRVVDGRIDRSAFGFEIGGQYVSSGEGAEDLEGMISGSALAARFGKHPRELGKDSPVWEELAHTFAFGLNNTILHWSPERVVLGGSMFNDIGIPIERVIFHLKRIMKKFPTLPDIVHSKLGDLGGLHGGLARLAQLRLAEGKR
jgi:predicted NBD/HSP70 family sugar kinase